MTTLTPTPFASAVQALPVQPPVSPVVTQTLDILYRLIQGDDDWRGSCHMSTVVAHILLTHQGVNSIPCVGDVVSTFGPFDHSWNEIDSAIYDLSIAYPLEEHQELALPPVIAGLHIPDGTPTALLYGTSPKSYGKVAIGNPAVAMMKRLSLTQYVDGAAQHGLDLWGVILALGKMLGLKINRTGLKRRHASTRWTVRDSVPVPPEMTRGWTVLH